MDILNVGQTENIPHSLSLFKEAFESVYQCSIRSNMPQLTDSVHTISTTSFWKFINWINRVILDKFGLVISQSKFLEENSMKITMLMSANYIKWLSSGIMLNAFCNSAKLQAVYDMLTDEKSRRTFDWFIKYKIVMNLSDMETAEKMAPYPTRSIAYYKSLEKKLIKRISKNVYSVDGYEIDSYLSLISATWVYKQYYLEGVCVPQKGDIIIEAGSFRGESAIWFSSIVGESGKVFSFEPLQDNIKVFKNNIKKNNVESIIKVIERGLWDENKNASIHSQSFSSICTDNGGDSEISVITLDSFVEENNLERVDIIKMDIEGSELRALRGAAKVIERFKPTLAICVYHKPEDIIEIPFYIKSLVPEYKIYISHKYIGWSETILFACMK